MVQAAVLLSDRFLFFFKQKTAYEVLRSLVGSEMCIRDRPNTNNKHIPKGSGFACSPFSVFRFACVSQGMM